MAEDLRWIDDEIEAIREAAIEGDDEKANSLEDRLHSSVLTKIAEGEIKAVRKAIKKCFKTKEISFHRWCA